MNNLNENELENVTGGANASFQKKDAVIVNGIGYAASDGTGAKTKSYVNQKAKVIMTNPGSKYPYALNCNNEYVEGANGVTAWFSASSITKA